MSTGVVIPRFIRAKNVQTLIGQCVPCTKTDVVKIKIKRFRLNPNLLMYYRKQEYVFATDPGNKCKPGDIVLTEKLPEDLSQLISHKLVEILYPLGDVTDPITGKKIAGTVYRDIRDKEIDMYGRLPSSFDYDSAPPRGWQAGKKDFTDKNTYRKYHEFEDPDPYAV